MLRVRAIKKYHDSKGILLGYTIQNVDNPAEMMNVAKDALKNAIMNGQAEVVNMTLTSDGRLIGKAAPEPKKKASTVNSWGCKLMEIYTNSKNISGGLIDQTENYKMQGKTPVELNGLQLGWGFEPGTDIDSRVKNGTYDNVKIVDGKPEMEGTKRKSFKSVKPKLIKILEKNGVKTTISVSKGDEKYEYRVTIDNYDNISNDEAIQIILCLIEDAMITARIKPLYIDEDTVFVNNTTGINDVRKAAKEVFKVQ